MTKCKCATSPPFLKTHMALASQKEVILHQTGLQTFIDNAWIVKRVILNQTIIAHMHACVSDFRFKNSMVVFEKIGCLPVAFVTTFRERCSM